MRYKFVENERRNNVTHYVTHIAFNMVDEVNKKFYGVAYFVGYLRMDWIGRIVTTSDEDFEEALRLYKKGCNMFVVENGVIKIS